MVSMLSSMLRYWARYAENDLNVELDVEILSSTLPKPPQCLLRYLTQFRGNYLIFEETTLTSVHWSRGSLLNISSLAQLCNVELNIRKLSSMLSSGFQCWAQHWKTELNVELGFPMLSSMFEYGAQCWARCWDIELDMPRCLLRSWDI